MPCYIGLDYGLRRVGIAVSDDTAAFAFALETHVEGRDGSLPARLAALVAERGAAAVVVGLPLTADGREGEMAARARRFADLLAGRLAVPVILWDERFSSREADRWLGERPRERGERDAVAAELILQGWLDRRQAELRDGGGDSSGDDSSGDDSSGDDLGDDGGGTP